MGVTLIKAVPDSVHLWILWTALICSLGVIPVSVVGVAPPICGYSRFGGAFHRARFSRNALPPDAVCRIKEFPFIVSIRTYIREEGEEEILINDGNFVGTLLDQSLALTSCICVANDIGLVGGGGPDSLRDPTLFGVTAGTLVDIHKEDPKSQFRWGWKILVHPKCNIGSGIVRYNIAVLIVERPFETAPGRVSALPGSALSFELTSSHNLSCLIVGWGWEVYGYKYKLKMIKPPATVKLSPSCDGGETPEEESCANLFPVVIFTGDTGSPVICSVNATKKVVGIRATSEETNSTHVTVRFVRLDVDGTKNWIDQIVKDHPVPRGGQSFADANVIILLCAVLMTII